MMEIGKRDFEPSWSIPENKGFAGEAKSGGIGVAFEEVKGKPEPSDGFVVLDIESLALLAAASASSPIVETCEKDSIAGNQAPLKKTLSKKGSQRGGERRTADCVAAASAAATDRESLSILIHVATDGEAAALPPAKTPTLAFVGAGGRSRRIAGRRQVPRLDPRRVVVLFATLSSMGTLILLYFTLSLGKMAGGNTNAP
ncbi:hypothetical protein KFK09_021103 [Dendrobium nobile]|uniref:Uncharacterized protein n=1 Tax=Dendrobium nobile TaxID=94219 RepID=A0A8T3AUW6_DENNO|nr:hypothetical protein KFK09_021103 [Dendrobium nobile]